MDDELSPDSFFEDEIQHQSSKPEPSKDDSVIEKVKNFVNSKLLFPK